MCPIHFAAAGGNQAFFSVSFAHFVIHVSFPFSSFLGKHVWNTPSPFRWQGGNRYMGLLNPLDVKPACEWEWVTTLIPGFLAWQQDYFNYIV